MFKIKENNTDGLYTIYDSNDNSIEISKTEFEEIKQYRIDSEYNFLSSEDTQA
ncbi:hypothetical protein [Staphylococcus capitis]|uniref:hypothetical protein n=1 Tax=Staphylococcus capitis TaxID=29388 RepID=UPI001BCF808E|nr:hypothetical protein [Staphylococcus capitis]